ncbi:hypothetical protein [Bacillus thuringiensis]|uniref:hypothetical protein n=1 Tax=Bacillus thuringiensis TaxID=1428 RepID=UPI000BFE338D|nr:hypothetical protein [Bacillus thuringiensis]PGM06397.1 hypothetical protein CN938_23365 [Bacillus thuringiensis]
MEEKLSLALAVKLMKIYEKDENQFLSFPMGLTYSYRSLDFMKEESDLSALERLHYKADFARMVNLIPADGVPIFSPSGVFLWNEMKDILTKAEFATNTLSQEEEKQLKDAKDFLTGEKVEADGTKTLIPSEEVQTYNNYKIEFEEANDSYLAEKLTIENATGEEAEKLKKAWETTRESKLRDIKDQAMLNWINLGYKNEVEAYQKQRNILEVKKYSVLYRDEYLNDINIAEIADAESQGIPFCVTYFNPRDAFDQNQPWINIPLIKEEIDSLVQQAPDALKGVFSVEQENHNILSMSLEYKYVGIKRPWFRPEFFHSRFWKMSDNSVVSDGANPRHGRVPAYITGMLVVRNIMVTKKKETNEDKANVLPILNKAPLQNLNLIRTVPTPHPGGSGPGPDPYPEYMEPVRVEIIRDYHDIVSNPPMFRPAADDYLREFMRDYLETVVFPMGGLESDSETVTETYNFDGVIILAFICQRVPKSPNPDPNAW